MYFFPLFYMIDKTIFSHQISSHEHRRENHFDQTGMAEEKKLTFNDVK